MIAWYAQYGSIVEGVCVGILGVIAIIVFLRNMAIDDAAFLKELHKRDAEGE